MIDACVTVPLKNVLSKVHCLDLKFEMQQFLEPAQHRTWRQVRLQLQLMV
jgi:hypothetical protein